MPVTEALGLLLGRKALLEASQASQRGNGTGNSGDAGSGKWQKGPGGTETYQFGSISELGAMMRRGFK